MDEEREGFNILIFMGGGGGEQALFPYKFVFIEALV